MMTENMKLWLKHLYMEAAEQHRGTAQNENIWALGSEGEAAMLHAQNCVEHVQFAQLLEKMAQDVDCIKCEVKLLSDEEYNVLNKVARKTKMDCWFSIKQIDGQDYIDDLEAGVCLDLKEGIGDLVDGLDYYETFQWCNLSQTEVFTLKELCRKLDIEIPVCWEGE
jgi:hypothetical protein